MLRSRRILSAASRNVNGGSLIKREEKLFRIIPLNNPSQRTSARFFDIDELATKTAKQRERARIHDEISRSFVNDMKDMKKHGGKVLEADKSLVSAASALKFPTLEVTLADGSMLKLPVTSNENEANVPKSDTVKVSLVCLLFRANAKPMVDSWIVPFLKAFPNSSDIRVQEVSLIDKWLLRFWPIKKLLLKSSMRESMPEVNQNALKWQKAWFFGDYYYFRKELKIINIITGYIFLLDNLGRVRWQGTGFATEDELQSLKYCTSTLLAEDELLSLLSSPSEPPEEKTAEMAG